MNFFAEQILTHRLWKTYSFQKRQVRRLHLRPIPQLTATQILKPLSETKDQIHILMDTSWVHYHWGTTETPSSSNWKPIWHFFQIFCLFLLLNEFITFIVVQWSSQPNFIAFPSQTPSTSLTPPPVSFGNHKFFKVCESVSILQRSSLHPFFRFHM